MYNLVRTISSSCTSVSAQTLKTFSLHTSSSTRIYVKRTQSLAFLPLLSRKVFLEGVVIRSISQFNIHPEKLKQMIRAKDGQTLCNFFASEEYKNRVSAIAEEQKRVLTEDTGMGLREDEIKYEHVLNCAQPSSVRTKSYKNQEDTKEEEIITLLDKKKRTKPIKTTVISLMLKKKRQEQGVNNEDECEEKQENRSTILPLVMKLKKKNIELKKKFRKRTMILPIFLKKMEQKVVADTVNNDNYSITSDARSNRKESNEEDEEVYVPYEATNQYPEKSDTSISARSYFRGGRDISSRNLTTSTNRVYVSELARRNESIGNHQESKQGLKRRSTPHEAFRTDQEVDADEKKRSKRKSFWGGIIKKWKPVKDKSKKETFSPSCEMNLPMIPQCELDASLVNILNTSQIISRTNNRSRGMPDADGASDGGQYLLKLPKTTPEGYRVLIYSVKDNDATKMNFSDCVKAFCMFNDVILSEDGLQEGYVVIFDMKGVQLGHLARVSLPALRCFMLYIQEAHPCRLKAIHVLNTASWIHHVMRLIVPLVKSELLNLVQFHRDDTPGNLPTELLPIEYGGEAASIEDLHKETTELLKKYQQWMVESAEYKSDESKRAKKASWWGLFGSTKSNAELDEKTILKNLQVD